MKDLMRIKFGVLGQPPGFTTGIKLLNWVDLALSSIVKEIPLIGKLIKV